MKNKIDRNNPYFTVIKIAWKIFLVCYQCHLSYWRPVELVSTSQHSAESAEINSVAQRATKNIIFHCQAESLQSNDDALSGLTAAG